MTPADAEAFLLTTEDGQTLLGEVQANPRPGPAEMVRWRDRAPGEVVTAAVHLVEARRKGKAKFERADRMWLDPLGVEQATAEPVARHKAGRFRGAGLVVDLCCGVGGDAIAQGSVADRVIAVDRDEGMARRTLWNAAAYGVDDRVSAVVADAERFPIPGGALVHVDPDRRVEGTRRAAQMLADYHPGTDFMLRTARSCPGGAIKLGPASDFDAHFYGDRFEVELVSLGGEAREATAWFGGLVTCRRRATRLPEGVTWTDLDGPPGGYAPARPLEAWAFDPDPALLRSGLVDAFAEAHGLGRIHDAVDFLTGPDRVDSPFLAAFEVVEELPVDVKAMRRVVLERGIGTLEIKVRGLEIRPESLRAQLRPKGSGSATLLLVGGGRSGPSRAVLARRASRASG
ncbi:class I SAM-dependent methyltransferase [Tautonia plasticadhaerens]|uniref:RNA cap guanine-N2 methyltransferase n=1 Tax=Tautonia plasticadhaerens TaxID=2527974 RepID=A0A518HCL2_9BACT|nr:class I SAM-dependent methyltransferase [Tautonia plasticadhaerens]QDV38604.1 RNA cap guanine-N2 methyltransferase [Tautonia plasticadhaerens]